MEKASRVMYSIANFFTWIVVICSIVGIVFTILNLVHVVDIPQLTAGMLVYLIVVLIISLITIALVRKAKGKNTSKGWDILFIVLGVLGDNIFYILGGIFGLFGDNRK